MLHFPNFKWNEKPGEGAQLRRAYEECHRSSLMVRQGLIGAPSIEEMMKVLEEGLPPSLDGAPAVNRLSILTPYRLSILTP